MYMKLFKKCTSRPLLDCPWTYQVSGTKYECQEQLAKCRQRVFLQESLFVGRSREAVRVAQRLAACTFTPSTAFRQMLTVAATTSRMTAPPWQPRQKSSCCCCGMGGRKKGNWRGDGSKDSPEAKRGGTRKGEVKQRH